MKLVLATLISVFAASSYGAGCEALADPDAMYGRFFQIAYAIDTVDGQPAYVTRVPSKDEAAEGWSCLEKASSLGNCSAIRTQELYYRHGVGEEAFGIVQDTIKADHFLGLKREHCGNN